MKKANPKDKQQKNNFPVGKQLKEIVPSSFQHLREPKEIQYPDQGEQVYKPEYLPLELCPEWTPVEPSELEAFQKPLLPENEGGEEEEEPKKYNQEDENSIFLPLKLFKEYLDNNVRWATPEQYIVENKLDVLIRKTNPRKNSYLYREKIHKLYSKEKNEKKTSTKKLPIEKNEENQNQEENGSDVVNSSDNDDEQKDDKYLVYRDFFNIIDSPVNIYVVNQITREETEEEFQERLKKKEEENLLKEQQEAKNKKKKPPQKQPQEETETKMQLTLPQPSNINLQEKIPPFSLWLGSIFQTIKDMKILDVHTGETIWQKIYPQKNGIPIYNPKGHYWVKLYHMGKLRKVDIDDKIPVSRNYEFFLPQCASLEEIWPALLSKAILKLYSYKFISKSYFEIGDPQPFYALTGYIPSLFNIKECGLLNPYYNNLNTNKNKNNKNANDEEVDIENEKENNNNNIDGTILKNTTMFLQDALTDENCKNSNYLVSCYKNLENNFYKSSKEEIDKNEYESLGVFNDEDRTEDQEKILEKMHQPIKDKKPGRRGMSIQEMPEKKPKLTYLPPPEKRNSGGLKRAATKSISSKIIYNFGTLKKINNALNLEKENEKKEEEEQKERQRQKGIERQKYQKIIEKLNSYTIENKIMKGILYNIVDFFNNEQYNMNRLLPIDFSDIKALVKNFNRNNVFKQLTREEKIKYIKDLKEIKETQKQEKAKRIEGLKLNGDQYYSVKIKNEGINKPEIFAKYSEDQILMAKKCLLNKWEFPPMDYLDNVYNRRLLKIKEEEEKLEEKKRKAEHKKNKSSKKLIEKEKTEKEKKDENKKEEENKSWNKDVYLQLINNNIDQYNNPKCYITRTEGNWIESSDFFNSFDKFLVLYNPSKFQTCFDWDNFWSNTSDVLSPKEENIVLYLKAKEPEGGESNTISNQLNENNNNLILMFETISDKENKLRNIPYKIRFLLIKKEGGPDKIEEIIIDTFYGSKNIEGLKKDKEYFLVYDGGIFPQGFFIRVATHFSLTPLSYQNFLCNHQGFVKQSFHVEHGNLNKNQIHTLLRLSIVNESNTKMIIMSNNTKDKYSNQYIKLYLCEVGNKNEKRLLELNSFFEINPREYVLVMIINPIYNVSANSYEVDILTLSDMMGSSMNMSQTVTAVPGEQNKPIGITIEQMNSIMPYEISDTYHPNKHFVLFKEYIFAGEKVNALLHIKIIDKNRKEIKEEEVYKNTYPTQETDFNFYNAFRLKLQLYNREKELLYEEDFYESLTLYNMVFEGNVVIESTNQKGGKKVDKKVAEENENAPPSNLPYLLLCIIDSSECNSKCFEEDYMNNISWSILVSSTDTLGFCQDTSKEDKEKAIIASWEEKENGRAELAKKSRNKFLLEQKVKSGADITKEEKNAMNEKRNRKTFMKPKEEEEPEIAGKGKKGGNKTVVDKNKKKKDDKKSIQDNNNDNNNTNNIGKQFDLGINYNKEIDQFDEHSSIFIKNYLNYAYNNRLLTFNNNYEQEDKILNTEDVKIEKEEQINNIVTQSEKQKTENINKNFKSQEEFQKDNKEMINKIINHRKKGTEVKNSFFDTRSNLAVGIQAKIILENKIKDILKSLKENPPQFSGEISNRKKPVGKTQEVNSNYEEALTLYKDALNKKLESPLVEELFNILSKCKENQYISEMSKNSGGSGVGKGKEKDKDKEKDKAIAAKIKEDINKYKWKISSDLMEEIDQLISS